MAAARFRTKRNALMTALTVQTTVLLIAPLIQIQTARTTRAAAAAAVTLRVTVIAAADRNHVQIVKKIIGIRW